MSLFAQQREKMVRQQIQERGISDERTLAAMRALPREEFVPENLREFAYQDAPLPIEEAQTISQPFIVALMAETLELSPDDVVLEVGAGSGYAAAVLGQMAATVYAIERHEALADMARARMQRLGYDNVTVIHGDGTKGLPERAPFDAIVVAAGGPAVPESLRRQLRIGGRLVIPVGKDLRTQELVRVRRVGEDEFETEELGRVQFVPLIGTEGWAAAEAHLEKRRPPRPYRTPKAEHRELSRLIARHAEPFHEMEDVRLEPLLERIGDAHVVLLGEATHGTSEFYRMRARISRELITRKGFNMIAVEADWPDMSLVDQQIRGWEGVALRAPAFSRFPRWMWRNVEMQGFIHWLSKHNQGMDDFSRRVSIHGLDVYSLYNSIGVVLDYLERVDPAAAQTARIRYGCLTPWERDPATYGRAAVTARIESCENEVVEMLEDLLRQRMPYARHDGTAFFDAAQNARVVQNAERYYRVMYLGSRESWNLRDQHMFDTLGYLMAERGEDSKAIVWAHNSHVGNASATEMGLRGEFNIGQLVREEYGDDAFLLGFGTDHGTVAAASNWDEAMQRMEVRPSHADSYERLCHETGHPAFLLPLGRTAGAGVRDALFEPHLERAIGVIYRPETELLSHYFQASLPLQFDEYVWIDESRAVEPLPSHGPEGSEVPETYPFGL
jgi:protein-L-isoaspartate(D-aspartate) O-methyltransferase